MEWALTLPLMEKQHLSFNPPLRISVKSCQDPAYGLFLSDPVPLCTQYLRFDSLLRNSLEKIVGTPLNEKQWLNMCLPVSFGGFRLRHSTDQAPNSYISLVSFSLPLIEEVTKCPCQIILAAPLSIFNLKCHENFIEESVVTYTKK